MVIRRLLRAAIMYGSRPQVVGCSATIANPVRHFRQLVRAAIVMEQDRRLLRALTVAMLSWGWHRCPLACTRWLAMGITCKRTLRAGTRFDHLCIPVALPRRPYPHNLWHLHCCTCVCLGHPGGCNAGRVSRWCASDGDLEPTMPSPSHIVHGTSKHASSHTCSTATSSDTIAVPVAVTISTTISVTTAVTIAITFSIG